MTTADTSVVVAAFASWHEEHLIAERALRNITRLPAHVLLETYSVLTRLPPPHRAPSGIVASFLAMRFPGPPLTLRSSSFLGLVRRLADIEAGGGAVYDALVAVTAAEAGEKLLTLDRRAVDLYQTLGVDHRFLT